MAGFERRLRRTWSSAVPPVPEHLQAYRQHWLQDLQAPLTGTTVEELHRAVRRAQLLVVSDYHPLERSRTGLAAIIQALPPHEPLVLVLELLPLHTTLTAQEALGDKEIMLVTGQRLCEAYRPALELLAQRGAVIMGAWVEGDVHRRDAVAAQLWQRIQRQELPSRAIFHFGDWHLAPHHLPARLAASGIEAMVIHQSPEPVWERLGANPQDRTFRTTCQHWVWLQTPPLSLWANLHQDLADTDDEMLAEAAEHLCESAAGLFATTFGFAPPSSRLTVLHKACWAEFHAALPRHRAAAFELDFPPLQTIFHPCKPLVWSPLKLDLSDLIQGAAHSLICDSPLAAEVSFRSSLRRNSFRFLCAFLVNPFLRTTALPGLMDSLWPQLRNQPARQEMLRAASALTLHAVSQQNLAADMEVLLERYWGQIAAARLVRSGALTAGNIGNFLDLGREDFDWGALTATIRVA